MPFTTLNIDMLNGSIMEGESNRIRCYVHNPDRVNHRLVAALSAGLLRNDKGGKAINAKVILGAKNVNLEETERRAMIESGNYYQYMREKNVLGLQSGITYRNLTPQDRRAEFGRTKALEIQRRHASKERPIVEKQFEQQQILTETMKTQEMQMEVLKGTDKIKGNRVRSNSQAEKQIVTFNSEDEDKLSSENETQKRAISKPPNQGHEARYQSQ